MKVVEGHRLRQCRRRNSRPTPYDLRRKVLVNNFLRDQHSPAKVPRLKPNTRERKKKPTQFNNDKVETLKSNTEVPDQSDDFNVQDTVINAFESLNTNDTAPASIIEPTDFSPETAEFLYLISRRLRISENTKLRQPCRRLTKSPTKPVLRRIRSRVSTTSKVQCNSISSSSDSDQNSSGGASSSRSSRGRDLYPLRSYPTFDRLNEVFECDEITVKKTAMFLRKRMNSLSSNGSGGGGGGRRSSPPISPSAPCTRRSSLRESMRCVLRRCKIDPLKRGMSSNNSDSNQQESDVTEGRTNNKKLKRRDSIVAKIVSSVRRNKSKVVNETSSEQHDRVKTRTRSGRSMSFSCKSVLSSLPKPKRRSASVSFNRNAYF